jgi:hypothetical protein
MMAYELFAGKHPFNTKNIQQLVNDILMTEPDLSPLQDRARETMEIPAIDMEQLMRKAGFEVADEELGQTVVGGLLEDIEKTMPVDKQGLDSPTDHDPLDAAVNPQAIQTEIDPDVVVSQPENLQTEIDPEGILEDNVSSDTNVDLGTMPVSAFEGISDSFEKGGAKKSKGDTQDLPKYTPQTLAEIIGKLLNKSPDRRYHDAYQVINDLCAAIGIDVPTESAAIRESFLQAATFVGRDQELQTLDVALTNALQGKGSAWLISGESGVGKSRLMEELRTRAVVQGAMALRGQGVSEGGLSYQLWREPLRRLALSTALDDLDASTLKDLIPDISQLLERDIPDAVDLEGEGYRQRLLGAIANLFQQQKQPIILLLEDLQWANESLEVLKSLSGLTANLPLLIVGNFRLEERPNLPDELPDMQVLKLERLSENSIADLSVSMLGEAGRQADVLELLQRETEGNVFFLVEVVRALAEEAGRLGAVGQMALPEFVTTGGVNAVIERRLARVPAGGRGLLRLAAIAGRELDLALLERMKDRVNLDEWLIACSNSAVLEILDGQWRFAHDKLREATVSTIPATKISKSHRHVAEAIEETYPDAPEQAAILAQHWREAGDRAKEYTSVQRAGDYGLHISAFMDAKAHFERSLELAPDVIDVDGSQQAEQTIIAVKLGEVLQHLGEY